MNNTKQTICEALRAMMVKQPLESISIQGVCDKAGLSRKTFSRHFADLQDVVRYQIYLDFIHPVGEINRIMSPNLVGGDLVLERNLRTMQTHGDYYKAVAKVYGSLWFADQLSQLTRSIGFDPYEALDLTPSELHFAEGFFADSVAMAFRRWLDEGMVTPADEVARMMYTWIFAYPRSLRGECSNS